MALVARVAGNKRARPDDFMPGNSKSNRVKLTLAEFAELVTRNTP